LCPNEPLQQGEFGGIIGFGSLESSQLLCISMLALTKLSTDCAAADNQMEKISQFKKLFSSQIWENTCG
jgi:hypothetical protein